MSVFIPGMKMPKKGFVTVDILSDGRVLLYNTDTVFKAVEIKTPHGRLIDADALEDMELETCDTDDGIRIKNRIAGRNRIRNIVNSAPTIIEAEGGGEDDC